MNTNEHEFEEMRQQMQTLKKKLAEQEIVNDRLIRQSMRHKLSRINRRNIFLTALAMFLVPYAYMVFHELNGYSIAFWIGTSLLMLVCAGANIWIYRSLDHCNLMKDSLVEAKKTIARAKKFETQWLLFGIPAIMLWLAWFAYEVYRVSGPEEIRTLLLGGGVGAIVGLCFGLSIYFKTQRQYQEIIDQIEDLSHE